MATNKFEYETYGSTMVLDGVVDVKTHEEINRRFTQALAQSMSTTKEALVASMLGEQIEKRRYEQEVDFDETK